MSCHKCIITGYPQQYEINFSDYKIVFALVNLVFTQIVFSLVI